MTSTTSSFNPAQRFALAALQAGLHPLPCKRDKKPAITRSDTGDRLPTEADIASWHRLHVALICGQPDNPVYCIDFDQAGAFFPAFEERARAERPELWRRLVLESSPSGGSHLWMRTHHPYRTADLAHEVIEVEGPGEFDCFGKPVDPKSPPKKKYVAFEHEGRWIITPVAIETRGATNGMGSYAVCDPSPGYKLTRGDLLNLPLVDDEDVEYLISLAREFEQFTPAPKTEKWQHQQPSGGTRPGDGYNALEDIADRTLELLIEHGWSEYKRDHEGRIHLARPGKSNCTSATLTPTGVFFNFSGNGHPFRAGEAYSPFAVFAMLAHDGDFTAAAKALAKEGFGGADEFNDADIGALIHDLNREFAVATIGSKVVVVREAEDEIVPLRRQDFATLLANRLIPMPAGKDGASVKLVPLSKIWLESPARRDAAGIVFKPAGCQPDEINLWRGLAIHPADMDLEQAAAGCRLYREHVENIICRGNAEHARYVWAWLADLVMNPGGAKPGVALVLRGGRGVGKGFFARPFLRIFGRHGLQVTHRDHLIGRFNHHLSDKIFVFLDEAFWAGEKRHEGVLKGLLTEPRFAVERKGLDVFEVDSFVRVVMASNEDWVVPAGPDERRFLVFDVSGEHKQDSTRYFKALAHELDHGGVAALLKWLMLRPDEGVDLRRAPASAAGTDQKLESLEPVFGWWLHCLHRGRLYSGLIDEAPWPKYIVPELALESFESWAKTWPGKAHMTLTRLAKKIYGSSGVCPGVRTKAMINGQPENCYSLRGLAEARMRFETFIGATGGIDWQTPDEFDDL